MANHGYISSKKNINKKLVQADLQEINERRFKGKLSIAEMPADKPTAKGNWYISYQWNGDEYYAVFHIWVVSVRKLEHRHTHNWGFYIELVFAEELGAKYGGRCTDEGFSGGWKPEPTKYPSYQAWLDIKYEHAKKYYPDQEMVNKIIQMDLEMAPEELRDC